MSHEVTMSFSVDTAQGKKVAVIPTVLEGKQLSQDEALNLFRAGRIKAIGLFDTIQAADDFANQRSNDNRTKMKDIR